jgi:hypothetical protein
MKNMANKAMASRSLKEAYDDGFTDGLSEGYAYGYDDGYDVINGENCEKAYNSGLAIGKAEIYELRRRIKYLERLLLQKEGGTDASYDDDDAKDEDEEEELLPF